MDFKNEFISSRRQTKSPAHPCLSGTPHRGTRGASRRQSTSPSLQHNRPNGSGPSANRSISKRARAQSAGASPKPASPKSPAAKRRPNQPAPNRRRQNAAQTSQPQITSGKMPPKPASPKSPAAKRRSNPETAPRIRRPKRLPITSPDKQPPDNKQARTTSSPPPTKGAPNKNGARTRPGPHWLFSEQCRSIAAFIHSHVNVFVATASVRRRHSRSTLEIVGRRSRPLLAVEKLVSPPRLARSRA